MADRVRCAKAWRYASREYPWAVQLKHTAFDEVGLTAASAMHVHAVAAELGAPDWLEAMLIPTAHTMDTLQGCSQTGHCTGHRYTGTWGKLSPSYLYRAWK